MPPTVRLPAVVRPFGRIEPAEPARALLGVGRCARMETMPLSDEEQKILREIEAQLNATDPGLV